MYFVCTREEDDCKELYGGAWGYYWNKEDAVDAVHRNVTDIHETIYPYAIIERLEQDYFLFQRRENGLDGMMRNTDFTKLKHLIAIGIFSIIFLSHWVK